MAKPFFNTAYPVALLWPSQFSVTAKGVTAPTVRLKVEAWSKGPGADAGWATVGGVGMRSASGTCPRAATIAMASIQATGAPRVQTR